ncbi:MAG: hypothetical protein ACPL0C_05365 [Candidatus Bathyarchaeales archaeon]
MAKSKGIILICFLWLIQSIGRLSFASVGKPEGMGQFLDVPISYETSLVMFVMFLFLGICGLITAFGLLAKPKLGFWTTIFASIATIAFDLWGLTIQYTATLGFVVPVISLIYLYPKRSKILQ